MLTVDRQITFADMQVRPADGAGQHLDQQVTGSRAGTGFSTYLSGLVSIGPGSLTTQACIVSELPEVIPTPIMIVRAAIVPRPAG